MKIQLTCCNPDCDKIVERWPSRLSESRIVYCSRECQEAARRERSMVTCEYCGESFERVPSRVNDEANYCCPEHFQAAQQEERARELGSPPLCACGCGKPVESTRHGEWCRYIHGHNWRGREHTDEARKKMSKAGLEQSRERSRRVQGENNPMWRGGHREVYHQERLESGFNSYQRRKARKRLVAERGHACERCGITDVSLELHHIDHDLYHNTADNLMLICRPCHVQVTADFIAEERSS